MNLFGISSTLDRLGFLVIRHVASSVWHSLFFLSAALLFCLLFKNLRASVKQRLLLFSFIIIPFIPFISSTIIEQGVPYRGIPVMPSYVPKSMTFHDPRYRLMVAARDDRAFSPVSVAGRSVETGEESHRPVHPSRMDSMIKSMRSHPWMLLFVLYLAGVSIFLVRIMLILLGTKALVRESKTVGFTGTGPLAGRLFSTPAPGHQVRVVESSRIGGPMIIGILKPVILLPETIRRSCTDEEIYVIILHETAHIIRRDPLSFLIVSLVRACFFFHPVVWVGAWRLILLSELACDDYVLRHTEDAFPYALALKKVMEYAGTGSFYLHPAACITLPKSMFYQRMKAILSADNRGLRPHRRLAIIGLFFLAAISFLATTVLPLSSAFRPLKNPMGVMTRFLVSENIDVSDPLEYSATAYAVKLSDITVDGYLDDWPEDMIRYPILNYGKTYGPTDIDCADLTVSSDLSPWFMVGYHPDDNLLYLAVVVRDDILFSYGTDAEMSLYDFSDACEVYLSGKHEKTIVHWRSTRLKADDFPALQYIMTAGGGIYNNLVPNTDLTRNPILAMGDITLTRSRGVCTRNGDVTVYEWALECFDRYPSGRTMLAPGKTIGFDVAVVDRDYADEFTAWGCWGPIGYQKMMNSRLMGNLVLLDDGKRVGRVEGTVVERSEKHGVFKQYLDIYQDGIPVIWTMTDSRGHFETSLLDGVYTVKPRGGASGDAIPFTVSSGMTTTIDLSVSGLRMPGSLRESIALYTTLDSYIDETEVDAVMGVAKTIFDFTYRLPGHIRQNYLRVESGQPCQLVYNGDRLAVYSGDGDKKIEKKIHCDLNVCTLNLLINQPDGGFVHQLMMSKTALKRLEDGLTGAETIGHDRIDGVIADVVEITTRAGTFTTFTRRTPDYSVVYRLWIGRKDRLIRKVETRMVERYDVANASRGGVVTEVRTYVVTHRHRRIRINAPIDDDMFVMTNENNADASGGWK